MFEINNLSFSFKKDSALVLDNINLDLPPRKCIGLLGNNGTGKSTLAYSLIGIIPELYKGFLKGEFIYENCNLLEEPLSNRVKLISYTFQDTESQILFGTVADIIGLNEKNTNKELIYKIIEILGIKHLLSRDASELSSGESQRVILTSSFRNNPELLIYDEAASALDPVAKSAFKKLIAYLLQENKTILLLGQRFSNLADYTSVNYELSNSKINFYKGKKAPNNVEKEISFFEGLNLESNRAKDFNISEILYYPKNLSGFKLMIENFEAKKGQNIALLGRNGAGKSTLLSILGGLIKPFHFKSDLSNFSSHTKLVFQSPSSQIIGANIEEELNANKSLSEKQKLLISSHFPFLDFAKDPLDLSFGQQRILCLLSAFLSTKPILLIDEPELGIDQINLNYIKAFFKLNKILCNKTILFSTHDLELAFESADICILIDKGLILSATEPETQNEIENWFNNPLITDE